MTQDSKGIIWIGTILGLFRYNGSSILDINRGITENQGQIISKRRINSLLVDDLDNIFFGTKDGLFILNQDSMRCREIQLSNVKESTSSQRYVNQVKLIGNSIFVGTHDGLFELDQKTLSPLRAYNLNGEFIYEKRNYFQLHEIFAGLEKDILYYNSRVGILKIDGHHRVMILFNTPPLKIVITLAFPQVE